MITKKQRILYHKEYYTKNKKQVLKQQTGYRQKHKEQIAKRKTNWALTKIGKKVHKKAMKKYRQTIKGKEIDKKAKAKRKRNMNWIKMFPNPFADNVEIEWHHISNTYVIALPKKLHQLYKGKQQNHREKMMYIVRQIYLKEEY